MFRSKLRWQPVWWLSNLFVWLRLVPPVLAGKVSISAEDTVYVYEVNRICDATKILKNLISYSVGLVGLVVFIMLLWGSFQLLTGGSNDQKIAQARQTITWGVIGLVLVLSSYFVFLLLEQFTGVTLTELTVPWIKGHPGTPPPDDCL